MGCLLPASTLHERAVAGHVDIEALHRRVAVADRGAVVGVLFAPQCLGGKTLVHLARHLEHAVKVMGEDGVALGSDFDGMIPLPQGMRDVRDLPKLTQTLLDRGMPVRIVEKVLGNNLCRFIGELLP
jgi:membrane dipeptidase